MKSRNSMNLIPDPCAPRAPPCRQPGADAAAWSDPWQRCPPWPAAPPCRGKELVGEGERCWWVPPRKYRHQLCTTWRGLCSPDYGGPLPLGCFGYGERGGLCLQPACLVPELGRVGNRAYSAEGLLLCEAPQLPGPIPARRLCVWPHSFAHILYQSLLQNQNICTRSSVLLGVFMP